MNSKTINFRTLLTVFMAVQLVCRTEAAWVKIEDFQSHALGSNVNSANGWVVTTGTFPIVADPIHSANKILSLPNVANGLTRLATTSIANNTTATVFLRFRFNGTMNYNFGMSDVTAPTAFADYESQFNQNDPTNAAHFRDAANFLDLSPASPLVADTWYYIWMVINNSTDTTKVYIDTTTLPGNATTALQSNAGKTSFTFRNSGSGTAANSLRTFLIMTSASAGTAYVDDIYLDTSGTNLVNPIPNTILANNDTAEVGVQGSIGIDVAANDTTTFGSMNLSSLTVVTPPTNGTATVDPVANRIVYHHTGSLSGVDSFQYSVSNSAGATGTATVNVTINGAMRIANNTLTLPSTPPPNGNLQLVDALPGVTFPDAVTVTAVPGSPKRLILASIDGNVWMVPDSTVANPVKKELFTVASLSNFTRGRSIYSVVCFPDFATSGNVIVTYQGKPDGLPPTNQIPNLDHLSDSDVTGNPINCTLRVSRFTISAANLNTILTSSNSTAIANAEAAILATEYRYINLAEQGLYHSINDCHFGALDGYLYVSFGDEGGQGEPCLNAQLITRDQFSSMIRIDLDRKPGNLEPNPHYAIITDNGVARFKVPADNPYVSPNPVYNGAAIPAADISKVRTEIWATGLRNPFKFYIDDTNGGTGNVWVGDVGMDNWEEVTILNKGDDAGWSFYEGNHLRPTAKGNHNPIPVAAPKFPEWDYPHSTNKAVIGGVYYRGNAYSGTSSLTSKYLFGDNSSGRIWSLTQTATPGSPVVQELPIGGLASVVCFAVDPQTDQILILQHTASGKLMRLIETPPVNNGFPTLLSQTGAFADMQTLEPNPGVVPYFPNLRFWSDNADKTRFFAIKNLTDQVGYSRDFDWTFPEGMVMVKHFNMELNRDFPGTNTKRLETRFIVRNSSGIYGVSYRWNDAGTEATLVAANGDDFDLDIRTGGTLQNGVVTGGTFSTQTWHIPSQGECLTCHNPAANHILSLNTQQLNRNGQLGQSNGNMLTLLSQAGYLSGFTDNPATLPRFYRADEMTVSLEERVRSYLTVNCTYCHRNGGGANQTWGTLGHQDIDQMGVLYGLPVSESYHDENDRYIIPGNPTDSLIWNRIQARNVIGDGTFNQYSQMPPLATNVVNQQDVQLLTDWINSFANVAPTVGAGSLSQTTISEDSTVGTVLGSVTATDPDVRNSVSDNSNIRYSITGGDPNNIFSIDPITGQITVNGILDFANSSQAVLQIAASDNFGPNPKFDLQTVTVNLTAGTSHTDANGNGIPDAWENSFGLTSGNPALDSDHDGEKDFFEYLGGGNPIVPDPGLATALHVNSVIAGPPAGFQYQWRHRNGLVVGQHYFVQSSTDLATWHTLQIGEYSTVSVDADGAGFSKITIFVPANGSRQFLRLSTAP